MQLFIPMLREGTLPFGIDFANRLKRSTRPSVLRPSTAEARRLIGANQVDAKAKQGTTRDTTRSLISLGRSFSTTEHRATGVTTCCAAAPKKGSSKGARGSEPNTHTYWGCSLFPHVQGTIQSQSSPETNCGPLYLRFCSKRTQAIPKTSA